jgi:protocatechuate 3,4-dioxygenase beta subunit
MALVQVNALKWVYANHHRQLRPIGMATTDDQGNYRLFSLEPGRYVLRASVAGEAGPAKLHYAPAYFPDAMSPAEASPIVLRPGDQSSADFRMTRVRAAKITGHVSGSGPGAQIQIYLRSKDDEGVVVARSSGTSVDRNGNFTLENVLPGDYILGALEFRNEGNENPQHAELPLKIDGSDMANANLALEDAGKATLQGTLRIDGANISHPALNSLRVGLLPAGDNNPSSEYVGNGGYSAVGRDGSLRLDRISPGQYVVSITADGSGWEDFYTKDVQIAGRDVTDNVVTFNASRGVVPITITVGIDGGYIEGTVTDDAGKPVANATVIGVPDIALRSQFDLYQRGESDQHGNFRLRGIKPGSYSFYAWSSMDDESYMDPEFLARYESAKTDLSVAPNQHQTLALKLILTDE